MKKISKIIFLPLATMMLSSCSILSSLINNNESYDGYQEYFEKELNYSKFENIDSLNKEIAKKAYQWESHYSSSYKNTTYYTFHNLMVTVYDDSSVLSVSTTDGSRLSQRASTDYLLSFSSLNLDQSLYLYPSGNISHYLNRDSNDITDEERKEFDAHIYENGDILAFIDHKHLVYLQSDLNNFYVSDDYTNVFQGPNDTKTIPSCDLLTNALSKLTLSTLTLPAPTVEYELWAGENFYKNKFSNYGVYIAGVDIFDYIDTLEANNFTVIRSSDDIIFLPFYKERAGSWLIHDEQGELKGAMSFQDYLYIDGKGNEFGPKYNVEISFYKTNSGYFDGRGRTSDTDWSSSDKENMQGWYDGALNVVIPFHPLGVGYSVPPNGLTSRASEDLFGGAFMLHQECYLISDSSIDYYLDGYDETLEAAGYHKYVPEYDLSDPEQLLAYKRSDESKYYECYINDELDCAIKFSFSFTKGNCIKVFKKSEMHSALDNPQ